MATPDYILREPYTYQVGPADLLTLEPGIFMRPIDYYYVPKHIIERNISILIKILKYFVIVDMELSQYLNILIGRV